LRLTRIAEPIIDEIETHELCPGRETVPGLFHARGGLAAGDRAQKSAEAIPREAGRLFFSCYLQEEQVGVRPYETGCVRNRLRPLRSASAAVGPSLSTFVMAGLVPATHVFGVATLQRRGCPRQARA
jgi:hypothetical protein